MTVFQFTDENLAIVDSILKRYPTNRGRSAILPLLHLAQSQQDGKYLSIAAMECVGKILSISAAKIYEVASFYSAFNFSPMPKYVAKLCGGVSCMLNNNDVVREACNSYALSNDNFIMHEVECVGSCINSPVLEINNVYYNDLDQERTADVLSALL